MSQSPDQPSSVSPVSPNSNPIGKILLLLTLLIVAGVLYWQFGDSLNLKTLADKEQDLRAFQTDHGLLVVILSLVIYIAVTGLSLPGAAVLTLFLGWFLGFWIGLVVVSFASTAGATLAFLFSRFILRDSIQNRFGERLKAFNESLAKEGPFYLFTLRLIPAIPFFVINLVMGLTPIRTGTFWWVSQLGMLPGTIVYVNVGASFPSLAELAEQGATGILKPQLLVGFILLGVFPIIAKKLLTRFKKPQSAQ